jgi:hypothetical protein
MSSNGYCAAKSPGMRVLLVSPAPSVVDMVRQTLANVRCQVEVCDRLDKFEQLTDADTWPLVLVWEETGCELAEAVLHKLRREIAGEQTQAVTLSPSPSADDAMLCVQRGASDYAPGRCCPRSYWKWPRGPRAALSIHRRSSHKKPRLFPAASREKRTGGGNGRCVAADAGAVEATGESRAGAPPLNLRHWRDGDGEGSHRPADPPAERAPRLVLRGQLRGDGRESAGVQLKLPAVFMRGRAEARALTIKAARPLTLIDKLRIRFPHPRDARGSYPAHHTTRFTHRLLLIHDTGRFVSAGRKDVTPAYVSRSRPSSD